MGVKRFREEESEANLTVDDTANCLMLLSKIGESTEKLSDLKQGKSGDRVFECKTCNKKFYSFQALGGHRASHKKLKLMAADLLRQSLTAAVAKPKTHACSICGLEFPLGQALGGHMRRHRTAAAVEGEKKAVAKVAAAVPILMRNNSRKRVFGFEFDGLDLNLTPEYEDLPAERRKINPPLLDLLI